MRLWYLQIYKGDLFLDYSIENRLRSIVVPAPRGMIFDREGRIMVDNMPSFDVTITPQYVTKENQDYVLSEVSKILNISKEAINDKLNKVKKQAKFLPVVIKEDIDRDELARVEVNKHRILGLDIKIVIRRTYMNGNMGAHLIGYIGEINSRELQTAKSRFGHEYRQGDLIGKSGIELILEKEIRGDDGMNFFEVDAIGRRQEQSGKKLFSSVADVKSSAGNNIYLTIDMDLQNVAENAFKEGAAGSVAAMDLKTGEMLVMTSKPSFDPTLFSRGIDPVNYLKLLNDPLKPLRNKLVQDHYPPGSTFKAVLAVAGLTEGIIDEHTTIKCPGWYRLGRRTYRCWKRHGGHGIVNLHKAIVESCDTYFWWVGQKLGVDVIAKYAHMLGLGALTGISLPEEKLGLVPSTEWKLKTLKEEWIQGETLSVAIGQGYNLVTPLQLLKAYSIIANDGIIYKPYYVKRIEGPTGKILNVSEPVIEKKLGFDINNLMKVKEGLFGVVNEPKGTARWTRVLGIDTGGKTGTSQVIRMEKEVQKCEEQPYQHRDHAFFVGFAPIDAPEIAVVAMIEHGCHGSTAAAPIVRDVIHAYFKKYKGWQKHIPTDRQKKYIVENRVIKPTTELSTEVSLDKVKENERVIEKENE